MIVPPRNFAESPEDHPAAPPPLDLLSDLLRSVRLGGERIVAHAPGDTFTVAFTGSGALHIVEAGEVAIEVDGLQQVERLRAGDAALLPRGDRHRINGGGRPAGHANRPAAAPGPARWLSGTFSIGDPQASHLLASLPPVIVLRGKGRPALEGLEVARRMLLVEMDSPSQGSAVMIARILDLLFIQILRAATGGTGAGANWLVGALDPQIGLALSAVHRDPGHAWTVAELARLCHLSRSAFAARFLDRVGKPPGTYLTSLRLDAATDMLHNTSLPVRRVAESVGYTSEAGFSRAFKNRYGTAPAHWRQEAHARRR